MERQPWLTRQLCFLDVARGHECFQASAGAWHHLALRECCGLWRTRQPSGVCRGGFTGPAVRFPGKKTFTAQGSVGANSLQQNRSALQECPGLTPKLTGPLLLLGQERGVGFTAQRLPRPRREQYQCSQTWERSVPCCSTASCTCRVQKSLFPGSPGASGAFQAAPGTAWPSGPGRKCHGQEQGSRDLAGRFLPCCTRTKRPPGRRGLTGL